MSSLLNMCMGIHYYRKHTKQLCCEKRHIWWSENLVQVNYVPSRITMSNLERENLWYTTIQVAMFAREEVARRESIGIKSRQALCPETDTYCPPYQETSTHSAV